MFSLAMFIVAVVGGAEAPDACSGPLSRHSVIACAKAASPRLRADRHEVEAARGRAEASRVLLPSNPTLAVTAGERWNTAGARALNVSGTLSQRIEIGGQRRVRRAAADAEVAARQHGIGIDERAIVGDALQAYYDVLAARAEAAVMERATATAERLQAVATARGEAGLGAPMEADLAAAELAGLRQDVALARGRIRVAEARLASALGLDPAGRLPEVRGDLTPLRVPTGLRDAIEGAGTRPELAREEAERDAELARRRLLRRERIPSPSLSFFAQTDGFNERVIGGGLSFPIPMPFPLGQTNKGEIDASTATIARAQETLAVQARRVSLEATVAYHELEAAREAATAYGPDDEASANRNLADLSEQIERGTLPVRDALLTQQALIGLLLRAVESRHTLCLASVALVLAAGGDFEEGVR